MNKYLIELLCRGQALQILLRVLAAQGGSADNAKAGHAVTKHSNLVVEIGTVALLDRVVGRLLVRRGSAAWRTRGVKL